MANTGGNKAEEPEIGAQLQKLQADMAELVRQIESLAQSRAADGIDRVERQARQSAGQARESAERLIGDLNERVERHPYGAMLAGLGIGLIAGLILNGRR